MASLKTNYILNLINTIAGMVFPLVTFPYASRILEADGIGIINFYTSIIAYISLFTSLGIPLYAVREIAKVKDNKELLYKTTAEIFILHIILTLLGYVVVFILCYTLPQIKENRLIFIILSISLLFTATGCDWYFRGIENFKFITIRGLICRIIYIPLLFIFVRTKQDLLIYAVLTVFVTVGNNLFNFYIISKILNYKVVKEASKQPIYHLKGIFKVFLLSASISLYFQLNIIMLGFLADNTAVGYFTAASKVTYVIGGVITALQTTLLPRSSNLLSRNNKEGFIKTLCNVRDFIIFFSLPMSAGIFVMAPLIIKLFAGETFISAIPTLRILSINIILSIYNGFICSGILLPQNKEKSATYACLSGGIVSLILSFILIPKMTQNGAAIISLITEIVVMFGFIILGNKFIPIKLWILPYFKYVGATAIMLTACFILWEIVDHETVRLVVIPIVGILVYSLSLFLFKDNFFNYISKNILLKLKIIRN